MKKMKTKVKGIEPYSIEKLFNLYGGDRDHALKVTRNCLLLYDGLAKVHGMGEEERLIMEVAG